MGERLVALHSDWQQWARCADRSEDGWESDYPQWDDLMNAAIVAMTDPERDEMHLHLLAACWAISHEDEVLADYAREHPVECWDAVVSVAQSPLPDARWQAYDALAYAGERADAVLRSGLDDPDAYCRRRAILALARLHPSDANEIAERFINDDDEYIRLAATDLQSR